MKSQEINVEHEESVKKDLAAILAPLSFFEKSFIAKYIASGFNGAAAYRATGRVVDDYISAGSLVVRRPKVRKAIDELLEPEVITAVELLKLISNIAKYSLNDYTEVQRKIVTPERIVDIDEYLLIYKKQLDFEYMYVEALSDNGRDVKAHYSKIDRMEDRYEELQKMRVTDPSVTFTVTQHPEYAYKEVFSFDAMVKSGDRVQIQEITTYADGSTKVKGYSSADAQEKLMKFYGKYEKDNKQAAVKIKITNKKDK